MEQDKAVQNNEASKRPKLSRWLFPGESPEQLTAKIEQAAQGFLEHNTRFSYRGLQEAGLGGLANAISKYYPGSIQGLKEQLGLVQERHPRGYWRRPDVSENIRQQALEFLQAEGNLTQSLLIQRERAELSVAISTRYPGGMWQLKVDLGIAVAKRPDGYWTNDRIRAEALEYFQVNKTLSAIQLNSEGRSDLVNAITKLYPGGWIQLRNDLNLKQMRVSRNPEQMKEEATNYCRDGKLDRKQMEKDGKHALIAAIKRHYPGGWNQLRLDLGLGIARRTRWSTEEIRAEAERFYSQEGKFTKGILEEKGYSGLGRAITRNYPGGWRQLRKDMSWNQYTKPKGYWTIDQIELEAEVFYSQNCKLSISELQQQKYHGLSSAISSKYPGGIDGLREKLGINIDQNSVTPVEANSDLERLLEV